MSSSAESSGTETPAPASSTSSSTSSAATLPPAPPPSPVPKTSAITTPKLQSPSSTSPLKVPDTSNNKVRNRFTKPIRNDKVKMKNSNENVGNIPKNLFKNGVPSSGSCSSEFFEIMRDTLEDGIQENIESTFRNYISSIMEKLHLLNVQQNRYFTGLADKLQNNADRCAHNFEYIAECLDVPQAKDIANSLKVASKSCTHLGDDVVPFLCPSKEQN